MRRYLVSDIFIYSDLIINNLSNDDYEYDIDNVEISNDMLLRFKESVKPISGLVKSTNIGEISLYPELHLYLDSFINLEILRFCNPEAEINLTSLNLILTRSLKLNELSLFYITIYSDEIGDANKILFPPTLTKLSINWCVWPDYYQKLRDNSITVPTLGPYSLLSTQKFNQLVNFEYSSSTLNADFNPALSILKNSPILRTLNLEVRFLSLEVFDLISRLTSLQSIELNNSYGTDIKLEDFKHHSSYSKIIRFSYPFTENDSRSLPNIELLLSRFHNLKALSLSFEDPFLPHIKNILEKLSNLQKFEIFNFNGYESYLTLNITNKTITTLNIYNFKVDQLNFKDFEGWYVLKSIELKFDAFFIMNYNYSWEDEQVKNKVGTNWLFFNCPDEYIRLYKK
ncbi:hypothetical protein CONCODRAFT_166572 [Conidiobolus coronatus NRRL 28638]|uniref:RNI-like protein n=1 Tax=Conidiobolus coronatus (strain ATCC 28846 / CBS 209.66 / NRRL 28638) TaxID=796925 RepID=A0A137P036_CONC2|nr:hypothetical protein CONCODRAFT_166572 [Conidiobolus coronatus NRRL 28638]|eukprot:KXN68416.1 hypothetical protein CONCODRAFT_166572 [Conidiobolus coronatus NRRL 28638]